MKKLIFAITIVLISCSKQDATKAIANDSFKILSYKTEWCTCQMYIARIKYSYSIDTTGVDYIEITSNLRQGQNYSFRHDNSKPNNTVEAIDLLACDGCPTTYFCSIIMKDRSVKRLPEIRL